MASKIPLTQAMGELIDAMDKSSHEFRRLYNIGVRGCRKFNMDIYGSFKTVILDVSANGTVEFPKDLLDWSMLGLVNSNGEAVPLTYNESLITLKQQYLASQKKIVTPPQIDDVFTGDLTNINNFFLNFGFNNYGFIHLYGIGGGTPEVGQFTVDEVNKCFLIDPCYPYSTIVLEYLTDGLDCETNTYMVDVFAVEALQWWVRWMNAVDLPKKYSRADRLDFKNEYLIQKRDAKARINKTRISAMQVVFRNHVKLVARA